MARVGEVSTLRRCFLRSLHVLLKQVLQQLRSSLRQPQSSRVRLVLLLLLRLLLLLLPRLLVVPLLVPVALLLLLMTLHPSILSSPTKYFAPHAFTVGR